MLTYAMSGIINSFKWPLLHYFSPLISPIIFPHYSSPLFFPSLIFPILQQACSCVPGLQIFGPSRATLIRRPIRMSKLDRLQAANGEEMSKKWGKMLYEAGIE